MLLTKYADYSIRVLIYLAERPGRKIPITAIADAYGISRNHLMKVSQNLAHLGYIIGYRGKGGGIALAQPARNINLGQVLAQVEPNFRAADPDALPTVMLADGRFHDALDEAGRACIDKLTQTTLNDLIAPCTVTPIDKPSRCTAIQ
jgi:Rrf2 family nitric oxide-sensitive transcriptional repressor